MRKADKISAVPDTLKLMQSLLWYNDNHKIFFSKHKTNNPQEYYCFLLDIKTGLRKHGKYRLTTENMLMEFLGGSYKVKYLETMRRHDIFMIQLINEENELDYHNFLGTVIPAEKGLPYTIEKPFYKSVGD